MKRLLIALLVTVFATGITCSTAWAQNSGSAGQSPNFLVVMVVGSDGAGFGFERALLVGIGLDEGADDNATNEHG